MSIYPEHDKLAAISDESQVIGAFLDGGKYTLGEWVTVPEHFDAVFVPVQDTIEEILADYFGISLARIEVEKRKMLDAYRERGGL